MPLADPELKSPMPGPGGTLWDRDRPNEGNLVAFIQPCPVLCLARPLRSGPGVSGVHTGQVRVGAYEFGRVCWYLGS